MIRIAQPYIGKEERDAVMAVLESGQLASGPVTKQLEERFAREVSGTREAIAVANGTAALHIALLAHGVGPGDEVITTPFTFQATANMILATGARPVFVDVGEDGNIDPSLIEAAITPRTKAILPVHLYGRLCNMDSIEDIAGRHDLAVIEDACQAHGASIGSRRAGSFGTGCFSLYATKNITTGEGGVITTNDADLAAKMRRIRSHGEAERYSSVELGFNYRLTDVAAAIGLAQLDRLDSFTERRRDNAEYLTSELQVSVPPPVERSAHVWHQYTIRVPNRDALQQWLKSRDIETAVHYPRILPSHPLYAGMGYRPDLYPVANQLAREVLSLPVHPGVDQSDLQAIVAAVNEWAGAKAGSEGLAAHG